MATTKTTEPTDLKRHGFPVANGNRRQTSQRLAELLRETEEHHSADEKTHGKHHWSDWYAPYLSARQNGKSPEEAAAAAERYLKKKATASEAGGRVGSR